MTSEWHKAKLDDVLTVKRGETITKKEAQEGPFPVILGGKEPAYYIDKYNHTGKAIVISRSGASAGYVSFWNQPIFVTDGFLLEPKEGISYEFLYQLLKYKQYELNHAQRGAAIPHVTPALIRSINIVLPPDDVRERIASILTAYELLIKNNHRRIFLLEHMAENLYKEWFVRFRFPGFENAEFVNGLPKGWKVEKLGNVARISTGKCNREDAEEDGIYPLFDRSQEIKKSSEWLKDCEAIIVPGEGTSFIPRYFWGKFNLHQRCYCVEPSVKNTGKFLFYMIKLNRKYFLSVATGATVPSLRYNSFAKMKFIMPELNVCERFNRIVSDFFDMIDSLQSENALLSRQRDMLIPRLMSGKLEVRCD